jgi:hypothetical protein
MGLGLGCNKCMYSDSDRRDRIQNAKAQATKLKQDIAEKDEGFQPRDSYYLLFDDRKKRYEGALKDWKDNRENISDTGSSGCPDAVPFLGSLCGESDNAFFVSSYLCCSSNAK